jgi:uncharacterized membrane protein YphA (DoxX/SURF4 family)
MVFFATPTETSISSESPLTTIFASTLATLALSSLLLVAGALKISSPSLFIDVVSRYELLPRRWHRTTAYVILSAELVCALSLLAGLGTKPVALIASLLFLLFSVGISVNLLLGRGDISCGCFGTSSNLLSWSLVIRNGGLVL